MTPTAAYFRSGDSRGERGLRAPFSSSRASHLRLASRSGNGDRSFESVYRSQREYVRKMIERRMRDPELAEDLTQETFLRAYRAWPAFNESKPAWPWLSTIAARLCSDVIRKREIRERNLPMRSLSTISDDELALARRSNDPESLYFAWVGDVIPTLLPRHSRVLLLQYWHGYPYKELARIEGMTPMGLHSLLIRARRGFRQAAMESNRGNETFGAVSDQVSRPDKSRSHSSGGRSRNDATTSSYRNDSAGL